MIINLLTCILTVILLLLDTSSPQATEVTEYRCKPTAEDEMGPLYKPGAPVRNRIGSGYILFGTINSAIDCQPVPEARVEVWMAGPEGLYGDNWRATLFSARNGRFYLLSHVPPGYGTGRAHIHIKVTAHGFESLVTQHYPVKGAGEGVADLTLRPAPD